MPKSLRTFLDDMRRAYPSEVVSVSKTVNPLTYDITAIVKQLGALKKFPVLIFEHPLNAHGQATDMKVVMSAENSQKKDSGRAGFAGGHGSRRDGTRVFTPGGGQDRAGDRQ